MEDKNTNQVSKKAKMKTSKSEKKTKDKASGKKIKDTKETLIKEINNIELSDGDKNEVKQKRKQKGNEGLREGLDQPKMKKKKKKKLPDDDIESDDGDKKEEKQKQKVNEELQDDKPKRNKKKKKKKPPVKTEEISDEKNVENKAKVLAIQYLQQWKKFKNVWSFQKVRQVWLLRNMYDVDMVDDKDFEILLEYLVPLKGLAKTTTLEKAEELLKEQEEESESSDEEDEDTPKDKEDDSEKKVKLTDEQVERVRQVIQILV